MHTTNLVLHVIVPIQAYIPFLCGDGGLHLIWSLRYSSAQLVHLKLPLGGADRKCPGESRLQTVP